MRKIVAVLFLTLGLAYGCLDQTGTMMLELGTMMRDAGAPGKAHAAVPTARNIVCNQTRTYALRHLTNNTLSTTTEIYALIPLAMNASLERCGHEVRNSDGDWRDIGGPYGYLCDSGEYECTGKHTLEGDRCTLLASQTRIGDKALIICSTETETRANGETTYSGSRYRKIVAWE